MSKSKEEIIKEIVLDSVFQDPFITAELVWDAAIEMAAEKASTEYKPRSPIATVDKQSILQLKFKK